MGPTQILFAMFFLWDRISFRWQQYKRRYDTNTPIPVTWDKFKAFLHQSLGDFQAFMDAYWGKIKRDSQHQLEEVLNWAAYLKHLQAVLRKFDPNATLNEEIMIRHFWEGLKPSVWAQLDTRGRNQDSWEEAVEKTVNAKAKTLLQSSSSICDMDSRCPQGNRLVRNKEKDSGRKNKSTNPPSADTSSGKQSFSTQQTSSTNPKKDQDYQQGGSRRQRGQQKQGRGHDSPITGVNATTVKKEEKDLSQVKYYNCHQKGHYATKCPQKSKN